jgi:hypothetical protein
LNAAIIAAAGISALAVFFFLSESESLSDSHARVRTQVLNAARWGVVIALAWGLIPAAFSGPAPQRTTVILGLAGLIGSLMLLPLGWLMKIGGREQAWELRRAKLEVTQLANKVRRDPRSVAPVRLQDAIDRIQALRTPASAELCDLIVSELQDLIRGSESWNEAGRRTIRIDQLSRELWPGAVPPPDFDPDEATFRWKMYRTFGEMMDIGVLELPPSKRDEFQRLASDMDRYRRPDTEAFIADIRHSADKWLTEATERRPWIQAFDFSVLGPNGLDEVKQMWGRDATLWGAELAEEDRLAIEQDLARRLGRESQAANVPDAIQAAAG